MLNALGDDVDAVFASLERGDAALSPPPFSIGFDAVCGAVNPDIPRLDGALAGFDSRNNRFVKTVLASMRPALDAALDRWPNDRIGICVGSSTLAMDEIERAYADAIATKQSASAFDVLRKGSAEGLLEVLRRLTGFAGPAAIVSNACASGGKAFASARRWLESGLVDAALVGGVDSLCQLTLRGFRSLNLLSPAGARPFSAERRGIHIGEGAAFALMERAGEGPRLLGTGETADAHHMTSPDPQGHGAAAAMRMAMDDAGLAGEDLDHVNAHGTGTAFNDSMEAVAIRSVLGERSTRTVVSTKGLTGHTLGAAGAIEAVIVLECLERGWTPSSAGAPPVDRDLGIEVSTEAVSAPIRTALSNSFAFGGSNVSLVFGARA